MNDITQIRNCIRKEIRNVDPSKKLFFSYLFSLRLYKEGLGSSQIGLRLDLGSISNYLYEI